jgi:nucleotide-binding universal stress UspA family protein
MTSMTGLSLGRESVMSTNGWSMYNNILVPVDGSSPSNAALREVIKITADRARVIRLVHVVDLLHWHDKFATGSIGDTVLASLREAAMGYLNDGKNVLNEHGFNSESILLESHGERAAQLIISYAKTWPADLIIMGTHGRRGLSRLVLGSDAAEVVRSAPTPVLLVRGQ